MQMSAYKDAVDKQLSVTIQGDVDVARAMEGTTPDLGKSLIQTKARCPGFMAFTYAVELCLLKYFIPLFIIIPLVDEDSDSDQEQEEKPREKRRRRNTINDRATQRRQKVLKKHPLFVHVSIKCKGKFEPCC